MESPDNDSAFCDNLSVLSSSNSNDAISANGSSNIHSYSMVMIFSNKFKFPFVLRLKKAELAKWLILRKLFYLSEQPTS